MWVLSCRGEKKNGSHCAVLVRPGLGGCLGVIQRERGPPSTVVGSRRNMLWFCFLLLCGPGCTQDLEIAPCRENELPTLYQCYPTIQFLEAAIVASRLGRRFHAKQRLSIFSLSAAMDAFSTSPLPDLLLVLPATNLVADLLSTCVCPSLSVS